MAGGRPVEYRAEIVERVKEYLALPLEIHEVKTRPVIRDKKIEEEEYVEKSINLPNIEGLALFLGIHKDTIYDWEGKYVEFSDVVSDVRAKQANALINKGISGEYNPTISKVLLTKHGYREGVEQTGKDGGPLKHSLSSEDKGALEKLLDDQQTSA